jgi:hypothetical protein
MPISGKRHGVVKDSTPVAFAPGFELIVLPVAFGSAAVIIQAAAAPTWGPSKSSAVSLISTPLAGEFPKFLITVCQAIPFPVSSGNISTLSAPTQALWLARKF